jgi:hypothetical protein
MVVNARVFLAGCLLAACTPPPEAPLVFGDDLELRGDDAQTVLDAFCAEHVEVVGDLVVTDTTLRTLSLDCVPTIGGDLVVDGNSELEEVGWSVPATVGGLLHLNRNDALTALNGAPSAMDVRVDSCLRLERLMVAAVPGDLVWTGGGILPGETHTTTVIEVPSVAGDLVVAALPVDRGEDFFVVELPTLVSVGGQALINSHQGGVIRAPVLESLGNLVVADASAFTLELPALGSVPGEVVLSDLAAPTFVWKEDTEWSVSSLVVQGISGLSSLDLPIAAVADDLVVYANPGIVSVTTDLVSVGGDAELRLNPVLVSFSTPGTTVDGVLTMEWNNYLGDGTFHAGPFVGAADTLLVESNSPSNESVCGLTSLDEATIVEGSFCAGGESALVSIRELQVIDSSFGTFATLTEAETLIFEGSPSPAITLPELVTLEYLGVADNGSLTVVDAPKLEEVGTVDLRSNPSLQNLEGFTALRTADWITFAGNDAVTGLNGLEQLEYVRGLAITSNQSLQDLDGLVAPLIEDQLIITGNPLLSVAETDALLERLPERPGSVMIEDNQD